MKKNILFKLLFIVSLTLGIALHTTISMAGVDPSSLVGPLNPTPIGVEDPLGSVIGGIQAFGAIAAVVVLIIIGIMYVTASPEGKFELKGKLLPFMIGAVLLFSITTIVSIMYKVFGNNG